jgi:general secretion pathway protein K
VLLLALVCLLALSGIAVLASKRASQESLDARYLAAEYQADLLAESLLDRARELILEDADTLADTPADPWAQGFEGEGYKVVIEPCNARLNLNRILEDERSEDALRRLLESEEVPPDNVEYLKDWIDADLIGRIPGAEDSAYDKVSPVYRPRNDLLESPEEALLVHGLGEISADWLRGKCTIWSTSLININFVSEEVFEAYVPELDGRFGRIEAWRRSKGFQNKGEFTEALPELEGDDALLKLMTDSFAVNSGFFRVSIEIQLPFVYEKRRYIVERNAFLADRPPEVLRGDVTAVLPGKPREGS